LCKFKGVTYIKKRESYYNISIINIIR
jgi:hypothetical protein